MWYRWNNSEEAQNRKISRVHSLLINKFAKWRISIQNNNPESQFFIRKSHSLHFWNSCVDFFSDAEVSSLNVFVGSSTWVSVIVVGGNPAWLLAFATVEKWRENVRLSGQMKSFKVESWGSTFESRHCGNSKRNPTFKPELLNSHFSSDSVTRKKLFIAIRLCYYHSSQLRVPSRRVLTRSTWRVILLCQWGKTVTYSQTRLQYFTTKWMVAHLGTFKNRCTIHFMVPWKKS